MHSREPYHNAQAAAFSACTFVLGIIHQGGNSLVAVDASKPHVWRGTRTGIGTSKFGYEGTLVSGIWVHCAPALWHAQMLAPPVLSLRNLYRHHVAMACHQAPVRATDVAPYLCAKMSSPLSLASALCAIRHNDNEGRKEQ